jgi:hypothetical protein
LLFRKRSIGRSTFSLVFALRDLRGEPGEEYQIVPGQRPFEILLAREHGTEGRRVFGPDGNLFYSATPNTIPASVRGRWEKRIAALKGEIATIEDVAFKRRWRPIELSRDADLHREVVLANGVEMRVAGFSEPFSKRGLELRIDGVQALDNDAVPYLAALRLHEIGLDKVAEWERTWDLQRREDAGETLASIPVPPKYAQKDYRSTTYWQLRGPLDVPKERFISYPGCESDHDGEAVYGWAGWDHEQRARALATLYWNRRTEESWSAERLTPMLAGLSELLPWLKQWHDAASDDYAGDSPANYYAGFLDAECRAFGLTHDDLRAWRPPEKTRGRNASAKKKKPPADAEDDP